jgi:hypothetical protein
MCRVQRLDVERTGDRVALDRDLGAPAIKNKPGAPDRVD